MKEDNSSMVTEEIIRRAQKRDMEAASEIYKKYKNFVWNISLKMTADRETAEDVTAEVFIKIFTKLKSFRFQSSFKTWIYRITVNTALNFLKKEKRRQTQEVEENARHVKYVSPEKGIEAESTVERILSGLNEEERILVVLREIEGLSYNEISEITKMNLGTVKTKIFRVREKLRKIYKEMGGDEDEV